MKTGYEIVTPKDLLGLVQFFDKVLPRPWWEQTGIPGVETPYRRDGQEEVLFLGLKAEQDTQVLIVVWIPRHTKDITRIAFQLSEGERWCPNPGPWTPPVIHGQLDIAEAVLALAWERKHGHRPDKRISWEVMHVQRVLVS